MLVANLVWRRTARSSSPTSAIKSMKIAPNKNNFSCSEEGCDFSRRAKARCKTNTLLKGCHVMMPVPQVCNTCVTYHSALVAKALQIAICNTIASGILPVQERCQRARGVVWPSQLLLSVFFSTQGKMAQAFMNVCFRLTGLRNMCGDAFLIWLAV